MVDPAVVIFAIKAAVKLGQATCNALVDSAQARPLLLPVGDLAGSIAEAEAIEFFDRPENQLLVDAGGPYHGFDTKALREAYCTIQKVADRLDGNGSPADAVAIIAGLHKFEQQKEAFGPTGEPVAARRADPDAVLLGDDPVRVRHRPGVQEPPALDGVLPPLAGAQHPVLFGPGRHEFLGAEMAREVRGRGGHGPRRASAPGPDARVPGQTPHEAELAEDGRQGRVDPPGGDGDQRPGGVPGASTGPPPWAPAHRVGPPQEECGLPLPVSRRLSPEQRAISQRPGPGRGSDIRAARPRCHHQPQALDQSLQSSGPARLPALYRAHEWRVCGPWLRESRSPLQAGGDRHPPQRRSEAPECPGQPPSAPAPRLRPRGERSRVGIDGGSPTSVIES